MTLSEIFEKAFLNTVLGMGTVFVVLIFISLVIGCFGLIHRLGKKAVPEAATKAPVASPQKEEPELQDDLELVAVISAAIAAETGADPSGLVVRSIRRHKNYI